MFGIVVRIWLWYSFVGIRISRYVSKIIMLTTSVEAICHKVRPLRDNTYPLMLRLTQHRKRKYITLGVSVKEKGLGLQKESSDLISGEIELEDFLFICWQGFENPVIYTPWNFCHYIYSIIYKQIIQKNLLWEYKIKRRYLSWRTFIGLHLGKTNFICSALGLYLYLRKTINTGSHESRR